MEIQKTCNICIHTRTCEAQKDAAKRKRCARWELDVKAWLGRGKNVLREIAALEEAKRQALERATSKQTTVQKKMTQKKTARGRPSRGDAVLVSYAEYSRRIDAQIAALNETLAEISEAIFSVSESVLRLTLINRYVLFKKWEEIALDMGNSYENVTQRLHPKALREVKAYLFENF